MERDPLLLNKMLAALLAALLVATMATFFADVIYGSEHNPEDKPVELALVDVEESTAELGSEASEGEISVEEQKTIAEMLANADIAHGKIIAKKCRACHTFTTGGANRVGPNLWSIAGRSVAAVTEFKYSKAMKNFGGSWTNEKLNNFIAKPKNTVSGTKMNFVGIKKPQDRADLIAWLNTLR